MNRIAIGCDHAGFDFKEQIKSYLIKLGYQLIDKGAHSPESVDYPDFAHAVATSVSDGSAHYGILICGSGNGVAMTANKHQDIRAAICWNTKLAALAREHNNANIIAIPARFVSKQMAKRMVGIFLKSNFEGGRHQRRVKKISC